jgi:hypothetical protein
MKAVCSSSKLVNTNMAARRRHQENHNINIHRQNNLKYFEKLLKIKADDTHRRRRGWGKMDIDLPLWVLKTKTRTE